MPTRILMKASAAFMGVLGLAATFMPQEILAFAGSATNNVAEQIVCCPIVAERQPQHIFQLLRVCGVGAHRPPPMVPARLQRSPRRAVCA